MTETNTTNTAGRGKTYYVRHYQIDSTNPKGDKLLGVYTIVAPDTVTAARRARTKVPVLHTTEYLSIARLAPVATDITPVAL